MIFIGFRTGIFDVEMVTYRKWPMDSYPECRIFVVSFIINQ